jgi:hypothetical protein
MARVEMHAMSADETAAVAIVGTVEGPDPLARFNASVEAMIARFEPVYVILEEGLAKFDEFERMHGTSADVDAGRRKLVRFRRVLRTELARLRQSLLDLPIMYFAQVVNALDGSVDGSRLAEARAQIERMSDEGRRDMRDVATVTSTGDVVGALVRGHGLVEAALERCILAAVRNPPASLRAELGVDCDGKIKLARMLGVVSAREADVLTHLTTVRNHAAHPREGGRVRKPYDAGAERVLWRMFVAAEPFADGGWERHDAAAFPAATTRCIVALWLLLGRRADLLANASPESLDAAVSLDRMARKMMPHVTALVTKAATLLEPGARMLAAG